MHGLRVCVFIMGYEKDRVLVHETGDRVTGVGSIGGSTGEE